MPILEHELHLADMASHRLARPRPEDIQGRARNHALEDLVTYLSSSKVTALNVLTLTIWTLERDAEMVPWARFTKPNLILYLRNLGAVEVPGQGNLERIQQVGMEEGSTPCLSTCIGEVPAGHAIIRTGNPRLKCDSPMTF